MPLVTIKCVAEVKVTAENLTTVLRILPSRQTLESNSLTPNSQIETVIPLTTLGDAEKPPWLARDDYVSIVQFLNHLRVSEMP